MKDVFCSREDVYIHGKEEEKVYAHLHPHHLAQLGPGSGGSQSSGVATQRSWQHLGSPLPWVRGTGPWLGLSQPWCSAHHVHCMFQDSCCFLSCLPDWTTSGSSMCGGVESTSVFISPSPVKEEGFWAGFPLSHHLSKSHCLFLFCQRRITLGQNHRHK